MSTGCSRSPASGPGRDKEGRQGAATRRPSGSERLRERLEANATSHISAARQRDTSARLAASLCEHVFVPSQGSAAGRLPTRHRLSDLWDVQMAGKELGEPLSLIHALAFLGLLAEVKPALLAKAAVRWRGRWELERSRHSQTHNSL